MSVADELTKLVALRDSGVLSQEEFEHQRGLVLAPDAAIPPPPVVSAEPSAAPTTGWGGTVAPVLEAATASTSKRRIVLAAVAGVAASIAAALVTGMLIPASGYLPTILGVVVGVVVAGQLMRARTVGGWIAATGLVILAQMLFGLLAVALLSLLGPP